MAKLSSKARQKLPSSSFALPGKGTGKGGKGSGSYPIPDASHARNALARVSQHGSSSEKATVRAKVHAKYPNIGKKQAGGLVPRMPRSAAAVPRMPTAGPLVGAPRPMRPAPITPRISGRLSSSAGMKKGGVASYARGGIATCGDMKGHGGFADLGIKK